MANKEHLDILLQGVDAWNQWVRIKGSAVPSPSPEFIPDLSDADLRHADLTDANLANTNLRGANLSGSSLDGANLRMADLAQANLTGAILGMATLQQANLLDASFCHAFLNGADLKMANMIRCDFRGAKLELANLFMARLNDADLSGASLAGANLTSTELGGSDLGRAQLNETLLIDVDLSADTGLDECLHAGPSPLDFRTLSRSGTLPDVFLRGCGLPDNLIEYLPSLLNQPIQFYSCFISFTENDDELAQRLYNDLQGAGVRCWRWKEDAKWGRSLMGSIDEAVRLHDKLVVLCSEDSLKSMPVIREIERALQREDALYRQGEEPEVLFPIRLDGYIFDEWKHPRKADVLTKTIGDFTDWKNHGKYQVSFVRLLKSLKPEVPCP